MNTYTLPYIPSNMDNEECFRLHGTLPRERIEHLLSVETDVIESAGRIAERVQAAHDGLPCEGFAEDIIYWLDQMYDGEGIADDATARELRNIIDALRELQADLYARAETAKVRLQGIEDELSAWAAS